MDNEKFGYEVTAANNCFVVGKNCTSKYDRCTVIGEDCHSTKANQLVIKVPNIDIRVDLEPKDAELLTDILYRAFNKATSIKTTEINENHVIRG